MMFRADLTPAILPIPDNWIHDGWIAFIIGAMAPVGLIDQCLVKYRQHSHQQIGGRKLSWREVYEKAREIGPAHYRLDYERFLLARERLRSNADLVRSSSLLSMVDAKIRHQERRLAISQCNSRVARLWWVLGELVRGRYARYSPSSRHAIKDLFL